MMNKNFASPQDRLENYLAGQRLMKRIKDNENSRVDLGSPAGEIGSPSALTKMFLKARQALLGHNPIVPNMADYTNWILYDRIVFAAGSNIPVNFKLFVVPNGTSGKTKVDTNMSQPSQLPQPYWINATHIGFFWLPNTIELDIVNFISQSYFEFWVNDKIYSEGPYQAYPAMVGLQGNTTQTAVSAQSNGMPTGIQTMYDLRLPGGISLGLDPNTGKSVITDGLTGINIYQSQLFKIENNLPAGVLALTAANASPNPGTGLTLYCFLHGILSRSVQ